MESPKRFAAICEEIDEISRDTAEVGERFAHLVADFLAADPTHVEIFGGNIWLWENWEHRWGHDDGIDMVAYDETADEYWAIQCKFRKEGGNVSKAEIDSFLSASSKSFSTRTGTYRFAHRMIATTMRNWGATAVKATENQNPPVRWLLQEDFDASPVDWSGYSPARKRRQRLQRLERQQLRPHQHEAKREVVNGFKSAERGQMIMACGTGKTLTALRIMEEMVPAGGHVLFLAPSLSLVSQALRVWIEQKAAPIAAFAVCSDVKVGRDNEDMRLEEMAIPPTTDARALKAAVDRISGSRRIVVFATYQSIEVVAEAQKRGLPSFDLVVCDEAHRTAGAARADQKASHFVKVHEDGFIRAKKRLYMTATPRIYGEASKNRAAEAAAELYSMDDEAKFGRVFYSLGFGDAVRDGLLSDYKVLIVAVRENRMADLANQYNTRRAERVEKPITTELATKIIGSWKGLSRRGLVSVDKDGGRQVIPDTAAPLRRAVAFSRRIADSRRITDMFNEVVSLSSGGRGGFAAPGPGFAEEGAVSSLAQCAPRHVDGTMNALQRSKELAWLKEKVFEDSECRILSNARCLSEGVDVPALDAVIFFDARDSVVDIAQSVGRVMRKAEGKEYGHVILPVCLPSGEVERYDTYIKEDARFKEIWKVLKALRSHDETLVDNSVFREKITVVVDEGDGDGEGDGGDDFAQRQMDFLPVDAITDAVYSIVPEKLGDREYWSSWAKDIAETARAVIVRIEQLVEKNPAARRDFDAFLAGMRESLNPNIGEREAVEMLAQHMVTLPVFKALFHEGGFPEHNAVARDLEKVVRRLNEAGLRGETEGLEKFYAEVGRRTVLAKSEESRQDLIRSLYDTFFRGAFPGMSDRLGIVYTPVEVVDFILRSVQYALRTHLDSEFASAEVQVLDPFAGTGTFLARLIHGGGGNGRAPLISDGKMPFKFAQMHANELVLLAYYIANVNIESAYKSRMGAYQPFAGMVLADTFQLGESADLLDSIMPENNERAARQKRQTIRVIVGNPPYSRGQKSENMRNKNVVYPHLWQRIQESYADRSTAQLKNPLFDSYIQAIRWASDRIGEKGIAAYVTNASFIDGNSTDGVRKCLAEEFDHVYVLNLRGATRGKTREDVKREGGNIFDIQTGVAISLLVKNPTPPHPHTPTPPHPHTPLQHLLRNTHARFATMI